MVLFEMGSLAEMAGAPINNGIQKGYGPMVNWVQHDHAIGLPRIKLKLHRAAKGLLFYTPQSWDLPSTRKQLNLARSQA